MEGQSKERQKNAKRHKELLNQFQEFMQDTKCRIEDPTIDISSNLFALNEPCLQNLISQWQRWFQENDKSDIEELEKKLKEIKEERDRVQAEFAEEYHRQRQEEEEAERKRQQEEARRAEIERIRRQQEQDRREREEIELWKRLFEKSFDLTSYLKESEYRTLLKQSSMYELEDDIIYSVSDSRFEWNTIPSFLHQLLPVTYGGEIDSMGGYRQRRYDSYEDYYDGEYYSGPKNRIYEPPSGMSGGGYSHFHRGVNTSIYGYDNGSSHGNHNGNENNY